MITLQELKPGEKFIFPPELACVMSLFVCISVSQQEVVMLRIKDGTIHKRPGNTEVVQVLI